MPSGIASTIGSTIAIAGVSTLGDFIWATWIPRHRVVYGLTHGALLFLAIGAVLGYWAGRTRTGAIAGAVTGFLVAGSFYVLSPIFGFGVMFAVWFGMWIALAVLNSRLARTGRFGTVLARGMGAAVLSGAGFYLVSGIWMPFNPEGWDYIVHFGSWNLAFLPGFAALLLGAQESFHED